MLAPLSPVFVLGSLHWLLSAFTPDKKLLPAAIKKRVATIESCTSSDCESEEVAEEGETASPPKLLKV